ncbi:g603 [Coccomyxa viridis]|uniref:G603 protein n=1 Tax=Coccomyxa viridis TaxID=1274662 RepID=A0ABP1FG48_9CHLO
MGRDGLISLLVACIAASGICMANGAANGPPRAGGLYIMEAVNASFASAQQVTLSGLSPATAYMIGYPYRDAGELDTATLIQDPTFNPQNVWLGGPVGSLFGTGLNATAVLFLVNGSPEYDYPSSTLTLNITVISDPTALKFRDGIARQTYNNALNPNQFAKPVTVTAQVGAGGLLTNVALYLDVDQTQIVPASAPAPAPAQGNTITNNNNNGPGNSNVNNNNNGPGFTNTNNNYNGQGNTNTNTNNNYNGPGYTNNNNNGGGNTVTNTNNNGPGNTFTNNNNNGPVQATPTAGVASTTPSGTLLGFTTPSPPSPAPTPPTSMQGTTITNNNGPAGTPVPSTPGQTPAPGTYNMVTTTTDCTGTTVQYSWVPGMRGVSRNTNNNCG